MLDLAATPRKSSSIFDQMMEIAEMETCFDSLQPMIKINKQVSARKLEIMENPEMIELMAQLQALASQKIPPEALGQLLVAIYTQKILKDMLPTILAP